MWYQQLPKFVFFCLIAYSMSHETHSHSGERLRRKQPRTSKLVQRFRSRRTTTETPGIALDAEEPSSDNWKVQPVAGSDNHRLCCFWASNGACDSNPHFMRPHCQNSCGTNHCQVGKALNCKVVLNARCPINEKHLRQTDLGGRAEFQQSSYNSASVGSIPGIYPPGHGNTQTWSSVNTGSNTGGVVIPCTSNACSPIGGSGQQAFQSGQQGTYNQQQTQGWNSGPLQNTGGQPQAFGQNYGQQSQSGSQTWNGGPSSAGQGWNNLGQGYPQGTLGQSQQVPQNNYQGAQQNQQTWSSNASPLNPSGTASYGPSPPLPSSVPSVPSSAGSASGSYSFSGGLPTNPSQQTAQGQTYSNIGSGGPQQNIGNVYGNPNVGLNPQGGTASWQSQQQGAQNYNSANGQQGTSFQQQTQQGYGQQGAPQPSQVFPVQQTQQTSQNGQPYIQGQSQQASSGWQSGTQGQQQPQSWSQNSQGYSQSQAQNQQQNYATGGQTITNSGTNPAFGTSNSAYPQQGAANQQYNPTRTGQGAQASPNGGWAPQSTGTGQQNSQYQQPLSRSQVQGTQSQSYGSPQSQQLPQGPSPTNWQQPVQQQGQSSASYGINPSQTQGQGSSNYVGQPAAQPQAQPSSGPVPNPSPSSSYGR